MHDNAMTGWAWQNSCGVGCAVGALVSFLSTPCYFLFRPYPLTYQVRECAPSYARPLLLIVDAPVRSRGLNGAGYVYL